MSDAYFKFYGTFAGIEVSRIAHTVRLADPDGFEVLIAPSVLPELLDRLNDVAADVSAYRPPRAERHAVLEHGPEVPF